MRHSETCVDLYEKLLYSRLISRKLWQIFSLWKFKKKIHMKSSNDLICGSGQTMTTIIQLCKDGQTWPSSVNFFKKTAYLDTNIWPVTLMRHSETCVDLYEKLLYSRLISRKLWQIFSLWKFKKKIHMKSSNDLICGSGQTMTTIIQLCKDGQTWPPTQRCLSMTPFQVITNNFAENFETRKGVYTIWS